MMLTDAQKENARAAGRTDLEHRWNLAASAAGFCGSEYVDEPEFVFRRIRDRLDQVHEWRKALKEGKVVSLS